MNTLVPFLVQTVHTEKGNTLSGETAKRQVPSSRVVMATSKKLAIDLAIEAHREQFFLAPTVCILSNGCFAKPSRVPVPA